MEDQKAILEGISRVLGRRGQTIYGRERIVKICAKAGVTLMDETGGDSDNSQESLERFLIEYSRFGPAAKLTLMILAKQHGIELSDKIIGKKRLILGRFGL